MCRYTAAFRYTHQISDPHSSSQTHSSSQIYTTLLYTAARSCSQIYVFSDTAVHRHTAALRPKQQLSEPHSSNQIHTTAIRSTQQISSIQQISDPHSSSQTQRFLDTQQLSDLHSNSHIYISYHCSQIYMADQTAADPALRPRQQLTDLYSSSRTDTSALRSTHKLPDPHSRSQVHTDLKYYNTTTIIRPTQQL